MNIAVDTDLSLLDPYRTEWASLRARRHNVLIEGPVAATHTVLRLLQPHIGKPILWKWPQARLELPSCEAGALILEDVSTLTAEDQTQLLTRLDGGSHTQIVSTSEQPLFVLVERKLFNAALYYRLNVVLLRLDRSDGRDPFTVPSTREMREESQSARA